MHGSIILVEIPWKQLFHIILCKNQFHEFYKWLLIFGVFIANFLDIVQKLDMQAHSLLISEMKLQFSSFQSDYIVFIHFDFSIQPCDRDTANS